MRYFLLILIFSIFCSAAGAQQVRKADGSVLGEYIGIPPVSTVSTKGNEWYYHDASGVVSKLSTGTDSADHYTTGAGQIYLASTTSGDSTCANVWYIMQNSVINTVGKSACGGGACYKAVGGPYSYTIYYIKDIHTSVCSAYGAVTTVYNQSAFTPTCSVTGPCKIQ